jgi:hypothetical protein
MLRQVMLDVKFTLFAVFLAIAVASPAGEGDNVDTPDYVVMVAEGPYDPNSPRVREWCTVEPADDPHPYTVLADDAGRKVRRGLVVIAPVRKSRTYTVTPQIDVRELTIRTRGATVVRADLPAGVPVTVRTR